MKKILDYVRVPRRFNMTASPRWAKLQSIRKHKLAFLIPRFRWFHVPLSFAFAFVTLGQIRKYRLRKLQQEIANEQANNPLSVYRASQIEVSMYQMLPLRTISRVWGWLNTLDLPASIRIPILRTYATTFGCNLEEALIDDLSAYRNLGEFFRRSLKPGLRPIYGDDDTVVSPSDGTILHMGSAKDGLLEQVKGITYTIESFLGPITWKPKDQIEPNEDYQKSLLVNNSSANPTDLYYCVIYLAPGDYHRFHSPANWTVNYRRHFPGKLHSVRPTFASWFPNLFAINERVAYIGNWKHGFFSMAPVGATNVGSVKIYFDESLKTNRTQMGFRKNYEDKPMSNVELNKGDPFGEFNLGSTVVLIFEAPKDMQFNIKQGMKIKYGELISLLSSQMPQ